MAAPQVPADQARPVAQQVPRPQDGELVFHLGDRDVRVAGDPELVFEAISLCDGTRTITEIAEQAAAGPAEAGELRALLVELLDQGAIDDCTRAWRHFHRLSSVGAGLHRPLRDDQIEELVRERYQPREVGRLGEPLPVADSALLEIAERRRSAQPQGGGSPVGLEQLGALLGAMYLRAPSGHRMLPSAGAIYPLALYLLARRPVGSLAAGLWWYEPEHGRLGLVRSDRLEVDGLFLEHPISDPLLSFGHPIVFVAADLERPTRKYSNRGYRFALMEAGAALHAAYLAGAELDVPVRGIGGIVESRAREFLDLRDDVEPLLAVLLGA